MHEPDTIVAAATPSGESALAVVRVSGPRAVEIALACNRGVAPLPRRAWRGTFHGEDGSTIDTAVFTFFEAPSSYTGEHVLEISCHGNPLIVRRIVEACQTRGCRTAEPGEFTRRAFEHGKMDLTEAEAVMDLIRARSDRAIEIAQRQLRGALGRRIQGLIDRLLGVCAALEAYIDFPDEDLPADDRQLRLREVAELATEFRDLAATRREGDLVRDGVQVVLVGEPNAGKSSLLNRLAGFDRAIVSAEPGTTRDYLEERILVGPHCVRVVDTAGLRPATGLVEQAGVLKTLERAEDADVVLLVVDATRHSPALPEVVRSRLARDNALVVINKSDLGPRVYAGDPPEGVPEISVSALTGEGMGELRACLLDTLDRLTGWHADEESVAVNARHAEALGNAVCCLECSMRELAGSSPLELAASELRGALDALGGIVGRIDNEAMLDRLFSRFCIGK